MPPKTPKSQGPAAAPAVDVSPDLTPMTLYESLRTAQNAPDNLRYTIQVCPILFDTTGYDEEPSALLPPYKMPPRERLQTRPKLRKLLTLPLKDITVNHGWSTDDEAEEAEAKAKPLPEAASQTLGQIAADIMKTEAGILRPLIPFHAEMYPHKNNNSNWARIATALVFLTLEEEDDCDLPHEKGVDGGTHKGRRWLTETETFAAITPREAEEALQREEELETGVAMFNDEGADREGVLVGFRALRRIQPRDRPTMMEWRPQPDDADAQPLEPRATVELAERLREREQLENEEHQALQRRGTTELVERPRDREQLEDEEHQALERRATTELAERPRAREQPDDEERNKNKEPYTGQQCQQS